ncbi:MULTISPECIES: MFS transporter [unclassified Microbacterium]|uniref:MFS transporter n=1 Tax=unclassified Microbacterium TaxID=2609290 RepID=UPI000EA98689|nr:MULTISPECIES: MFS transporter [unclassified Microbacterium]MBT2484682.1 MFS transporter [Microbacterium sp. ISL-108]RKN67569.1 MFS transporter [Microbacterium sp. CGR2]
MPSNRRSPLPAQFTRIAWSNVLIQFAEQMALIAAPLAAVVVLGVGATGTALLQVAQTLPFLLLSIPFGVLVDRYSPKRLLLASEALRTLTLAVTAVLVLTDWLTFGALLAVGFLGAIGSLGVAVGIPSTVPQLVSRDRLMDANRWLELGRSVAFVSGPVIGGAIVSLADAETTFVVATIICGAAVVLLARLDVRRPARARSREAWREVADGLRYVLSHELLRPMIVTSMIFNVGWFLIQSVFVVYALRDLGMTAASVGTAIGVYGAGMVLGAVVARSLSARLSLGRMSVLGPIGGFLAAVLMVITLWLPTPALALFSYFLFGLGPVLWSISTTSLRQAVTPTRMIGRVSSLLVISTYGARPIGAGLGAVIAATLGMEWCIAVAVVVFAAQLAVMLASPLPALRELPVSDEKLVPTEAE